VPRQHLHLSRQSRYGSSQSSSFLISGIYFADDFLILDHYILFAQEGAWARRRPRMLPFALKVVWFILSIVGESTFAVHCIKISYPCLKARASLGCPSWLLGRWSDADGLLWLTALV
jgi:hypothetical protein